MNLSIMISNLHSGYDVTQDDLIIIEQKYSFKIPDALRLFYLRYNGAGLKELYAYGLGNEKFGLHEIYPIKYRLQLLGNNKVAPVLSEKGEMEWAYELAQQDLPLVVDNALVPFASDSGGDEYYWQKITGAVFLIRFDDIDTLIPAFDSVEAFFDAFIKVAE
jgi:hypothetical protein